jgi:CRP-like cAMP-binding protein
MVYTSVNNCEACIGAWKNFKHLSPGEIQLVNENKYEATFKPGEIIIKQGSPATNAVFLASGMAKIFIEGENGKNYIMGIALPSRLIIGPGAYIGSRHSYSVSALTFVQVCFISFSVFKQLVRQNGFFAEGMLEDISAKSLKTHNKLLSLTQKKMHGRLAETLLYFADEIFNSDEYELMISRQELGEMTNMARESVVRILRELEESGAIIADSSLIKIIDKDKLRFISEKG